MFSTILKIKKHKNSRQSQKLGLSGFLLNSFIVDGTNIISPKMLKKHEIATPNFV